MYRDKIFGVVLVFATIFIFFQVFKDKPFLSNLIKNYKDSEIIQAINKEVSNPGALVAKIESSKAFLTKDGVFVLTNKERSDRNISQFASDAGLDEIARRRMNDMFAKGYFEHVSPSGESASSVADDIKYEYISIGENIALGNFETDAVLVQAWMDSPGHRANILNSKFTHLGVAVGKGLYQGRETWIGVQIFSKPLSACPAIDESLKAEIDLLISEIEEIKEELEKLQYELDQMQSQRRQNRDEYNAKVEEYNAKVREVNAKNAEVRSKIEIYNRGVKGFNACVGQ